MKRGPKYIELTEEVKQKIIELVEKGYTDKEIYQAMKISHDKFYCWMKEHPDFKEQLKKIKRPLNIIVENSLFKRANGYKFKETTKERDENGNMVTTKVVTKEVPPDPTSMIFWLKNRMPQDWRDKQEIEGKIKADITGLDKAVLEALGKKLD